MMCLRVLGNEPGALRLENIDDLAALATDDRVQQDHRDGNHEAHYRRHQSLRNTTGHHLRVACAVQRNDLEGLDHAGNRTKQPHERRDNRYDFDE